MDDSLCRLTLKALEGQSPDLLLQKKHVFFIRNRIGYSYVTGWFTEGAPRTISKLKGLLFLLEKHRETASAALHDDYDPACGLKSKDTITPAYDA